MPTEEVEEEVETTGRPQCQDAILRELNCQIKKKLTRTLLIFSLIILCKIIGWVRYFSYALSSESQLGVLTFPFIIRNIVLTSAIMSMVCERSAFESMIYDPI